MSTTDVRIEEINLLVTNFQADLKLKRSEIRKGLEDIKDVVDSYLESIDEEDRSRINDRFCRRIT